MKKLKLILLVLLFIMAMVGCMSANYDKEDIAYIVDKENLTVLEDLKGEWIVDAYVCKPRNGMVSEDVAMQSDIIGKELYLNDNLDLIFDGQKYEYSYVKSMTVDDLMTHYSFALGDAMKIGCGELDGMSVIKEPKETTIIGIQSGTTSLALFKKDNGEFLIFAREQYGTDALYSLKKI